MNLQDTIKFLASDNDVDAQLAAFYELNSSATAAELPFLLEALESTNNFWVRELLSEPIIRLAGVKALPELLRALQRNFDEGHDNDGFQVYLIELAESDPVNVKDMLDKMQMSATQSERDSISWLRDFCC